MRQRLAHARYLSETSRDRAGGVRRAAPGATREGTRAGCPRQAVRARVPRGAAARGAGETRRAVLTRIGLALALLTVVAAGPVDAQTLEATRARLQTVLTAAPNTPDGQGLLPTAIAEARTVLDRALRAERADDLAAIHQAADAILAALDPRLAPAAGGYGIRRATQELAAEVAAIEGDRAAGAQHTVARVQDGVRNVLAWCDALADVAQRLHRTTDLAAAQALTPALRQLAQQILQGRDADGDGRVTFAPGEAGLHLVQVSVRMRAATGGLLPDLPRAPGPEVRR